jgi:hypothetical protein
MLAGQVDVGRDRRVGAKYRPPSTGNPSGPLAEARSCTPVTEFRLIETEVAQSEGEVFTDWVQLREEPVALP